MIRFPGDVDGWLTQAEGTALAVYAHGRRVLEIGSYKGRSTICMAQTARVVVAVDPFDGRATPNPGPTLEAFQSNLRDYGVAEKVAARVGTIAAVGPDLGPEFDLVFIDGAHDYQSVRSDIEWALKLLKLGGLIAFHDYQNGRDPGVDLAVRDLLLDGGELILTVDSLALVRPPRELITGLAERQKVVLAMPHRGQLLAGASRSFFEYPTRRSLDLMRLEMNSSVLTLNFNRLWCEALNAREAGFTRFAMLHDDVCPDAGWLDVLLDELDRNEADVVSAVVPFKSTHGLTTTACGWGDGSKSIWRPLRRITMTELFDMPETFDREAIRDFEGPPTLLINTGCWVADLTKPWVEKNVFRNVERIVNGSNGRWKADCLSEDWAFSCDLARWEAHVLATRKVPLYHGRPEFHNRAPWGAWETDEEYFLRVGKTKGVLA